MRSYDGNPGFRIKDTAPDELKALFVGVNPDELIMVGGALTTVGMFEAFDLNPCHLNRVGTITRFMRVIASRDDIKIEGKDA